MQHDGVDVPLASICGQQRCAPSALRFGAVLENVVLEGKVQRDPTFGFDAVSECPAVPREILIPRDSWADGKAYDAAAKRLAELFSGNVKTYEAGVGADVKAAGPLV